MRIVQIGGFLVGAQKTIEEGIHRFLIEHGHESYIFYEYGDSDEPNIICYENRFENIVTRLFRKLMGKNPHYAFLQTKRLIRYIERINPDIIHLHVLHDGCVDYELLLSYIVDNNIPVVYTMHDLWALTGGCYHYTLLKCEGHRNGCVKCDAPQDLIDCQRNLVKKSYYQKRKLLTLIQNYASVAVSYWVYNEIRNSFLANRQTYVIHNCIEQINNESTASYQVPIKKAKYRLISIACTWDQSKGLPIILSLADMIGNDYEILLIGNASEELKNIVPQNVIFGGYCTDKRKLYCLLAEADLYISASFEETFGMTFVEAAYAGTRSVGFNSTAISETLELVNGICVNELTTVALCSAVKTTIQNNQNKLNCNDIKRIRKYFSYERMSNEYYAVYEKLYRSNR